MKRDSGLRTPEPVVLSWQQRGGEHTYESDSYQWMRLKASFLAFRRAVYKVLATHAQDLVARAQDLV